MAATYTPARVLDRQVTRIETTAAWKRVHRLGSIAHYGATYDRPDFAAQAGAELVQLATKQFRLLDENGGKAS